jgi:hypothetical protein
MKTQQREHLVQKVGYFLFLLVCSSIVLILFLRHGGINDDNRFKILNMVDGTAYKPFVYRTLMPTTVRILCSVTPRTVQGAFVSAVERDRYLTDMFKDLGLETSAAYQYLATFFLVLICLICFGHYAAKLTLKVCGMMDSFVTRTLLATTLIMAVPSFSMHDLKMYDPSQLFLFTLALYFLEGGKLLAFVISFAACCINKETAVILIPIFAVALRGQYTSRKYICMILALTGWYVFVELLLVYLFRSNPGGTMELHLLGNVGLLTDISLSSAVPIWIIVLVLCLYRWADKPAFYKVSFLFTLPPLVILGMYFGVLNEWRDYYEAYPIVFGMALHSILSIKRDFALKA